MADDQLGAELDLDISGALSNVDDLGTAISAALSGSVNDFADLMGAAVAAVPDVQVAVDADATTVTPDIDAAVTAADGNVTVTADGADVITGDIDAAVTAADTTVPIEADTSNAQAAIAEVAALADAQNPVIDVEADTSNAQSAIEDLSASADSLTGSTSGAAAGTHQLEGATALLGGASALATGEVGGLKEVAAGAGVGGAAAAVGIGALAGGVAELYHEGVAAVGAGQRFNSIVGDMRDQVESVHIGDLSAGVADLGIKFGSTDAEMKNAISSVFQFGVNGGKSREESAQFSQQLVALAARAISLNPNLGSLSDVTEQMATRMSRGGRFAASFGLSLSAAEINAAALGETGKKSAGDLTIQEKSFAAAQIAAERYGNGLSTTVAQGAANATNVQKSLLATVKEMLERFGAPLVIPMFDLIRAGLPIVESLGHILSTLATSALPVFTNVVTVAAVPLQVLADVVDALAPALPALLYGFIAFKVAEFIPFLMNLIAGSMLLVGPAATEMATSVAVASAEVDAALGPIGWIIGGLSLAAAAFGIFGGGADQGSQKVTEFKSALVESNGALDDHALKAQRAALEERGQLDALNKSGISFKQYTDAIHSASGATAEHIQRLKDQQVEQLAGQSDNAAFVRALDDVSPALGKVGAELDKNGQLSKAMRSELLQQISATQDATTTTRDRSKAGADDAAITKQQADATMQLATSALPALEQGEQQATQAHQAGVVAMTDGVAALARYEGGALSLADTETALKAAQDALKAAVLDGNLSYAAGAQAALTNKAALDETASSLIAALTPLAGVMEGTRAYNAELTAQQTANANAEAAMGRYTSGTLSAKEATGALDLAAQGLQATLDLLLGRYLSQESAELAFDTAIHGATDSIAQHGIAIGTMSADAQANASALVQAGQSASTWSQSIAAAGGTAAAQVAPLQQYRDGLQQIRDNMAAAGADTTFVDGLIAHTDQAIGALNARVPVFNAAGVQIGTATTQGAADGSSGVSNAVITNTDAAAGAVGGQVPIFDAHGNSLGTALATGAGGGAAGTSSQVTAQVDKAGSDAALAGANMHNIGYGIGAAFIEGIAAGADADSGYLNAVLSSIVSGGVAAARAAAGIKSPSTVFADAVGLPIAQGIALGVSNGADLVNNATAGLMDPSQLGAASSAWTPGIGSGAYGPGDTVIQFNIQVSGVSDPVLAQHVGEQIGDGAVDALVRRGVVTTARLG